MVEDRIAALEARAETLEDRVRYLEGGIAGMPPVEPPPWVPYLPSPPPHRLSPAGPPTSRPPAHPGSSAPRPGSTPPYARSTRPAAPARPARDIEDFLGGSVLAWLGGVAVLAGLAFLLTIAISRGWLGEGARTALAGALSLGLLAAGVWLREHRDRTEAALVASAVGIAGLFGTLVVAGPVYGLIPQSPALFGAFAIGAAATALAVRWRAPVMGWLGLLGALLAPATLGAFDGGGITFLVIAYAATIAVLVWQRWTVLAIAAVAITTVEWLLWIFVETPGDGAAALVLAAFGVLTATLALGLEANRRGLHPVAIGPEARPLTHPVATGLLVVNAALIAAVGFYVLPAGEAWLAALAGAHLALGVATARSGRISRELALILLAAGVVLANIAFAFYATGLPLVLGWAASAIPFAALLGARSAPAGDSPGLTRVFDFILGPAEGESAVRADRILAMAGLLSQMALAAGQSLLFSAPPDALAGSGVPPSMLLAAGALAAMAWACAQLVAPAWRTGLYAVALAAVAHLTGLALEGAALTAVFAAEALALAELARRRDDKVAGWAAVAFAGAGLLHALGTIATPDALLVGLESPLAATAAFGAAAIALTLVATVPLGVPEAGRILRAAAALTLLYLASVLVVTLGGPEHTGQTLLSVLWAVAGVGALIRGLLVDDRPLRRGALVLIAVTATKVFLYDLAALDSMYRVASLVGFGLLLLCGAFAYQRVRPQE